MCFVPGLELGPVKDSWPSVFSAWLTLLEGLSCRACKYLGRVKTLVVFATHRLAWFLSEGTGNVERETFRKNCSQQVRPVFPQESQRHRRGQLCWTAKSSEFSELCLRARAFSAQPASGPREGT